MGLNIIKGKEIVPLAIMLYAREGFGKSSFGSEATKPLFIGNEVPTHIDVNKVRTKNFLEFVDALNNVIQDQKMTKEYKTIVIDSIDGICNDAQDHLLEGSGGNLSTYGGGYGAGYVELAKLMTGVLAQLKAIRSMGYNIVLLAHETVGSFEDQVTGVAYSSHEVAMHKKVAPLFIDWVQILLFGQNERLKRVSNKKERLEIDVDSKILYTKTTSAHRAKSHFNLPEKIEYKNDGKTFLRIAKLVYDELTKTKGGKNAKKL